MTVHFIGAGPGAADLITVRGARLLASCPVCLHAGSIVPPGMLGHCAPGTRLVDTASLDLDTIIARFASNPTRSGMTSPGCTPATYPIYSAVAEQLRRLSGSSTSPYTLTPGRARLRRRRRRTAGSS